MAVAESARAGKGQLDNPVRHLGRDLGGQPLGAPIGASSLARTCSAQPRRRAKVLGQLDATGNFICHAIVTRVRCLTTAGALQNFVARDSKLRARARARAWQTLGWCEFLQHSGQDGCCRQCAADEVYSRRHLDNPAPACRRPTSWCIHWRVLFRNDELRSAHFVCPDPWATGCN